ncbi:MAG: LD-carboxypeptidase [Candidatus Gastranaerophilales bacterium]|nr:LD-carboxypeptidase [Candidatus Gastranaerophilales bacterium]
MQTIGIIALSGACDKEKIENSKACLEKMGFKVKLSKNIFDRVRYLAGSDEDKLAELYRFFKDPEIDLILNARGGYGTIRLINKIDYDIIKNNQKPFIGFSDITALLLMFYKKAGLITYHGPMASSDFGGEISNFTNENFFRAINSESLEFCGDKVYREGDAQGIIWGGNLATVVSLCGEDFVPDEDFIFFTEDLNEPVYKIDKMFQQLFNMEKFSQHCKGIVLGDFLNVDNEIWLNEYFQTLPVPAVSGFKITHAQDKITLPIGKKASLRKNILRVDG